MLNEGFPPDTEPGIFFFEEDIDHLPDLPLDTKDWILRIADQYKVSIHRINYIFCSDQYLLQLNREYLDHDTLTDIVTFPLSEDPIEADIFISVERVKENAKSLDITEKEELCRVMVHGILHLCGFGDKTKTEKQEMRKREDESLSLLKQRDE